MSLCIYKYLVILIQNQEQIRAQTAQNRSKVHYNNLLFYFQIYFFKKIIFDDYF